MAPARRPGEGDRVQLTAADAATEEREELESLPDMQMESDVSGVNQWCICFVILAMFSVFVLSMLWGNGFI